MSVVHRGLRATPLGLLFGLGLILAAVGIAAPEPQAAAQPRAAVKPELVYVPEDAAIFLHADVAKIWDSPPGKSLRAADPKLLEEVIVKGKTLFGETPDNLRTVTLFVPKLKGPEDTEKFGVVLSFHTPCDTAKLKAGIEKLLPSKAKVTLHTPSDKLIVVLVGLGDEYAKPRAAGAGPLAAAIRDAATGNHVFVAGTTLANLPDEIRGEDLPEQIRPFRPLLKAETITARVSLDTDITLDVRVKAANANQAIDAERALGVLGTLLQEGIDMGLKEVEKDGNPAMMKDIITIIKAAQVGVKGVKFTTVGDEARATVKIPANLPFGGAFVVAAAKLKDAASLSQSSNNLKQIGLAMHNYHDTYNGLPPAAICDKAGRPLLSWRVLILPYIEYDNLYKEFHLDEAWDSDHNKKLLAKMPRVYALPTQKPGDTNTHYRVFVGNDAAFDYLKGHRLTEFTDGTSNTLLVVTAADAVPWTKPDELAFDPKKDMTKLLGTVVNGRCQAAFADGSVRTFGKIPTEKTLNALITRNGGEVIEDFP